jgi:molecular chaperone GrpE
LLDLMRGFQQGIEDILYRQGVEPYTQDGDAFDPRRQRAVATVATDDPETNKRIAARHRKGFQAGEKVIRPEVVSVYALKK